MVVKDLKRKARNAAIAGSVGSVFRVVFFAMLEAARTSALARKKELPRGVLKRYSFPRITILEGSWKREDESTSALIPARTAFEKIKFETIATLYPGVATTAE